MLGSDPQSKTVWYIPTAPLRDGWSERDTRQYADQIKKQFGIGRMEWIDPEYVKGTSLRTAVERIRPDVVWAEMGNTYNICHHLNNSGAAELIHELVDAGAVYVGSSAGSIMAGRTIQMAFWKDWDDRTCEGTVNVDWTDPQASAAGSMPLLFTNTMKDLPKLCLFSLNTPDKFCHACQSWLANLTLVALVALDHRCRED